MSVFFVVMIFSFGAVNLHCVLPTHSVEDLNKLSILLLLGGCVKYGDI